MPCFTYEISKAELFLACLESHEDALLDRVRQRREAWAQWYKYASSYEQLVWRLFEASGRIKSELCRGRLFGCFESDWRRPHMECAGHVMSHAPYVGICECVASKKVRRLSGSLSSEIRPSVSNVMSFIVSDVTVVSGVNSVGEEKSMKFKTYRGPLLIHLSWYELPLGTCQSIDLTVAPSHGKEHDARDMIRTYKDTLREDAMEFGYSYVHAQT